VWRGELRWFRLREDLLLSTMLLGRQRVVVGTDLLHSDPGNCRASASIAVAAGGVGGDGRVDCLARTAGTSLARHGVSGGEMLTRGPAWAMPAGGSCLARPGREESAMNKDEIKGRAEAVKGKAKQAAGDLTDDERLREEGVAEEAMGEAREDAGRARRKVGERVEEIGEKIKR
jgi:uncharacterized protein YjbJ (UPF0337 family)